MGRRFKGPPFVFVVIFAVRSKSGECTEQGKEYIVKVVFKIEGSVVYYKCEKVKDGGVY